MIKNLSHSFKVILLIFKFNKIVGCLRWNPTERFTPDDGLRHEWILEGLIPPAFKNSISFSHYYHNRQQAMNGGDNDSNENANGYTKLPLRRKYLSYTQVNTQKPLLPVCLIVLLQLILVAYFITIYPKKESCR